MNGVRLLVAAAATLAAAAATAGEARAQSYTFALSGPGVSGRVTLTYGAATDTKYPNAFKVTGVSGTFSDANNGLTIVNASIAGLVPIAPAAPEPSNLLAPADFSRFAVAAGNPNGGLSYDNLFWPGGSPQTATDYPFGGGFLDIYGLLFDIGGGRVVNVWSNGVVPGAGLNYGVAVTTAGQGLDYIEGGVSVNVVTPEPGVVWLVGAGGALVGMIARRRRAPAA